MADENEQPLDEKQAVQPKADALDSSSESETQTEHDANADVSMNDFVAQQLKEQGKTVEEGETVVEDPVESEGKEEEVKAEAESKESVSESEKDKTETEKVEEGKEADKAEEKKEEQTEGPVPYERFKEVNDRAKVAEDQFEAVKAEVEDYRKITGFLQRSGIDRDLFTKTMLFLADFQAGNIEKVAPQIKEWAAAVSVVEGTTLPGDLQKAVDTGEMDLAVAQRIAKAEARANMVEKRGRKTVEQIQQEQFEQSKKVFDSAAEQWEVAKRKLDPDYKPKATEGEPDGVWEDVQHVFHHLINQKDAQSNYVNPVNTAQQLNALQERAYQMVQAKLKRYRGVKPAVKSPLDSKRAVSENGNGKTKDFTQAKTMGEAIRIGMRQLGHSMK